MPEPAQGSGASPMTPDASPVQPGSSARASSASSKVGSAATAKTDVSKAKPQVGRGYLNASNSPKVKALDAAVNEGIEQVNDDDKRVFNWWKGNKNYFDLKKAWNKGHLDPKKGWEDSPILEYAFQEQDKKLHQDLNSLNEAIKADIRERLGTFEPRPNFEKRVREIAVAMSRQFGIKAAAERAATEVIKETYKPLDDVVKRSFEAYQESVNKRDQLAAAAHNNRERWSAYYRASAEVDRPSRIFRDAVKKAVFARIEGAGMDVDRLTSKTKTNLSDAISDKTFDPFSPIIIDRAILEIKLEKLTHQRAAVFIQRVLDYSPADFGGGLRLVGSAHSWIRMDTLVDFYPPNDNKLIKELRNEQGYWKILADFVNLNCFHDDSDQPLEVKDVMATLGGIVTWLNVSDIAKDVILVAKKYAKDHKIELPAAEIAALYKEIDDEAIIRANEETP